MKGIAGTKDLATTLKSRCITFRMSQATRKLKLFIDKQQCTNLRNKLLTYRLNELAEEDEGIPERQTVSIEQVAEELEGSSRLAELFYPLVTVSPTQQIRNELIAYAQDIRKQRIEQLKLLPEVTVLSAIIDVKRQGLMQHGRILIADITQIINSTLPINEHWTHRYVGSICKRIGFSKTRIRTGQTAIIMSTKLIQRLKQDLRYTSCFDNTLIPSGKPSTPTTPSSWEQLNPCVY